MTTKISIKNENSDLNVKVDGLEKKIHAMELQIANLERSLERLSHEEESVPLLSNYSENLSLWSESDSELWNNLKIPEEKENDE